MVEYTNIPEELKQLQQWVVHKAKTPHSPKTGRLASVTDSATWSSFEDACTASKNYDGLGFVFTAEDPFVGVDFDHCFTYGLLDPWVAQQLQQLDSYAELSPSGTGLHVICKGQLPASVKRSQCELYDQGRYFTVTGNVYGQPRPIRSAVSALSELYNQLRPQKEQATQTDGQLDRPPVPLSDGELLEKARTAQNGERFAALFAGDCSEYGGDHSRADMVCVTFWPTGQTAKSTAWIGFSDSPALCARNGIVPSLAALTDGSS